jgi:hypothetical protein
MYADITLETVALDTHNSVAAFSVTDAAAECASINCPLSTSGKSTIF